MYAHLQSSCHEVVAHLQYPLLYFRGIMSVDDVVFETAVIYFLGFLGV